MTVGQALRSAPFIILVMTNFFCCATHCRSDRPHRQLRRDAAASRWSRRFRSTASKGSPAWSAASASVCSATVSAPSTCWSLDLLAQAFGALGYFFVRELAAFYAVAAAFGFIYAGVMPLYAVLARENFPQRMMGTIIGGTSMAGGLGMATGPTRRRADLRHLRELQLALSRRLGHGHRRFPDGDDVQAVPEGAANAVIVTGRKLNHLRIGALASLQRAATREPVYPSRYQFANCQRSTSQPLIGATMSLFSAVTPSRYTSGRM